MHHEIFASQARKEGQSLDSVLSVMHEKQKSGTKAVGFKLFYNHLTLSEWEQFASYDGFDVIHLTRKNRLRTILSLDLAMQTDQWVTTAFDPETHQPRCMLPVSTLIKRMEKLGRQEARTRKLFEGRRMLEVVYEDMVESNSDTFSRLGEFLRVDDLQLEKVMLRKQNAGRLVDLIANYDEVHDALKNSEYCSCLDD